MLARCRAGTLTCGTDWIMYAAHEARRCIHLVYFAHKKGVHWILEQPRGSTMLFYKPMQKLIEGTGARVAHLDMGCYGAKSVKPTVLEPLSVEQ